MGKILIFELILMVLMIPLIQHSSSNWVFAIFLAVYILSGRSRKYYFDTEIAYAAGILQNLLAVFLGFIFLVVLSFNVWVHDNILLLSFFMVPLGVVQFFGEKRYFVKLFAWLVFYLLWCLMTLLLLSPPEFSFHDEDKVVIAILLVGVRVYEILFDRFVIARFNSNNGQE